MKQGILIKGRVRLILEPDSVGFICRKVGAHRRKAVRGCIIGTDIANLSLIVVKKGDAELEGLTDATRPNRLGPKRANKIAKMFQLPRHSDNLRKKGADPVTVKPWTVTQYVVRRAIEKENKTYYKAPRIQRLVTAERRRRKRVYRDGKVTKAKASQAAYAKYLTALQAAKEVKRHRSASG